MAKARRTAASTRRIRRSVIQKLQTPRRDVWSHRRSLMEALGADKSPADGLVHDPLANQPTGDSADDFAALTTTERGWVGTGALAAVIIAAAASLTALSGLFRAEAVSGGGLIPVSASLGDIWHHASSWWISLGAGLPGKGDPFGYVLWVLGVLGGGDANAAMAWLLLLGAPLSGLTAWFAAGGLTARRRFRFVAALFWAAAPALQVALNQGRAGALVAHLMIPLVVLALLRATGSAVGHGRFTVPAPGDRRFTDKPPVAAGHQRHAVLDGCSRRGTGPGRRVAAAPSLLVPAGPLIVLCGLLLGRRGRTVWWALLPSAALFIPFGLSVLDRPRALLADPGVPLGFEAAPLWQQLLGQPLLFAPKVACPGFPFFERRMFRGPWCSRCWWPSRSWLLAVAALFLPGKRAGRRGALWVAALIVLAGGWLAGHVATGATRTPWSRRSPVRLSRPPASPSWAPALIGAERSSRCRRPCRRPRPVSGQWCSVRHSRWPWWSCWPAPWPAWRPGPRRTCSGPAAAAATCGQYAGASRSARPGSWRPATPGPFPPRQSTAAPGRSKHARC